MPGPRSPDATHIEKLTEVGRYALGVVWADRHDSILPFRSLRRACPCETCTAAPQADLPPEAERRARRGARRPKPLPRLGRRARERAPARGGACALPLRALRRRARVPDLGSLGGRPGNP